MDNRQIMQQSLDYIEDNLLAELTASELAAQAGFSLFHYYRLFQAATGMPVMQYILRRRLLHGIYAVGQGASKTSAALAVGFDTYAGFYRAFCREFGCSPSDYLKSGRAKRPYRINLLKEEHFAVTHKKAAQILKYWNLEDQPINDIYQQGTGAKIETGCYVGDSYVLKYSVNPGRLKKHIEVSKAIESVGLLAAVPIPTADGREVVQDGQLYFCVTRRLPGQQLMPESFYHRDADRKAQFVGEIIGQLHLALGKVEDCVNEADLLDTVKNWALPAAKTSLGLSDTFCEEFIAMFDSLYPKLPRQIIHRDPSPANIICSQQQWGFIDFELTERNARIYDPCYAATALLSESFGRADDQWLQIYHNILRGYDQVVHLTEIERRAAPYILLANQLVCVAWFAQQEKHQELFETNKQMTLWLLQHFEQLRMF